MGGEELPGPGETDALQRTVGKVRGDQLYGERVSVRIARDLAQEEIATAP